MGTGYNGYPFYLDETAEICDVLSISAGQRGTQIFLAGTDLIRATGAISGSFCK